ncbi:hypothetical protein [Jiangella asiatica]|uniref:Uncharacterized protein n=1 Tax=Jiangella asiatica TaxID=2530372 RepID=A0A4R5CNL7_9ACTN|nr:hypothetical protein [Jiangella asiatica]TDE02009.1 hypothetical protein E1269_22465 [Jiangella asiatica]
MTEPVKPFDAVGAAELRRLTRVSVSLISGAQHPSGAYPAAVGFAPYGFAWFRDGAFVAEGMSRAGAAESATAFHRWCAGVLSREARTIDALVERLAAGARLQMITFSTKSRVAPCLQPW